MDLYKVLKKELILVPLTETTKEGVISQLVSKYATEKKLSEKEAEAITAEVLNREDLGSTAMDNGIALPHAKLDDIDESAVIIGISRLPIDFGGKEKTKIFFLVLAPESKPAEHVQVLASIARVCSSSVFVRLLSSAKTANDVYELFFD